VDTKTLESDLLVGEYRHDHYKHWAQTNPWCLDTWGVFTIPHSTDNHGVVYHFADRKIGMGKLDPNYDNRGRRDFEYATTDAYRARDRPPIDFHHWKLVYLS